MPRRLRKYSSDAKETIQMKDVYKQRKVSAIRDFPLGHKQFPDLVDLESTQGQASRTKDEHFKATGLHDMSKDDAQHTKRGRFVDTEEEDDDSCGSKNETESKQHQRIIPKRRKVSAMREFPPALVRVMPFNPIRRHIETPDSNITSNSSFKEHDGYRELHNIGDEHIDADVENEEDLALLVHDALLVLPYEYERNESSSNSSIELQPGKVASINHLEVVEHEASDIVCCSDGATTRQESKSNVVEQIDDGHGCLPDDMLHLDPIDVPGFFSDNHHNGFIFEDDVEPLETISQPRQDVSQGVIGTTHESGIMDHPSTPICTANHYDDTCHSTKVSGDKRNQKNDRSNLYIPPNQSSYKDARGFSQGKFSKENPSYRTGTVQAKEVQREVIKLEGGRYRVGKVKYMPEDEGRKALGTPNNLLSKACKKTELSSKRVIIQGLMAAEHCPWKHNKQYSNMRVKGYQPVQAFELPSSSNTKWHKDNKHNYDIRYKGYQAVHAPIYSNTKWRKHNKENSDFRDKGMLTGSGIRTPISCNTKWQKYNKQNSNMRGYHRFRHSDSQ